MNIPAIPKPVTISFFDKVVTQIQDILKSEVFWLDHSFGQSQQLVTKKNKRDFYYPGVHIGNGTYVDVLPNQSLGNYSFFILDDPYTIEYHPHVKNRITVNFGLIFWLNLKDVFPSSNDRNIETIKEQLLDILTNKMLLNYGRITVNRIQQQARNIYREYSLKEIDSQFLMFPYAGLRFDGVMSLKENC